jgi:hypothetical protein
MGVYIKPADFRSGDVFFRAMFGKNALKYMEDLQDEIVTFAVD